MKNPYSILMIPKNQSLKGILEQLKGFTRGKPEIYSNENYEELVSSFKSYDEEAQKEKALDALVNAKYKFFSQVNNKLNPQKEGQFQKSQEELKKAYEMISTEEKRKMYAEKEIHEKKEKDFFSRHLENFFALQIELQNPMNTQNITSKQQQESIKNERKESYDPNDKFPNYTGYPYRWGAKLNQLNPCLIQENNAKGEYVIATNLGDYIYERLIKSPTKEYPVGHAAARGMAKIIGITKFDSDENLKRTDVVIAELSPEDYTKNKEFFRDIFVSDELINHAKDCNYGFIGSISVKNREGAPVHYIEYNGCNARELVSSLAIAESTNGIVKNKSEVKTANNFEELKEKLAEIQEKIAIHLIQGKTETKEEKGENGCQK